MSRETEVVSRVAQFGRVPVSLLLDGAVSDQACRLYAYLTTYDFKLRGEVWPGRERAAKDLGWSVRTLDRCLAQLDEHGAIRRTQAGAGQVARVELLADIVDESALPDLAALPNRVVSLAKSSERTSLELKMNETARDENLSLVEGEPRAAVVERVFAAWQRSTNRPRARLDAKRRALIERRLREYDEEYLLAAVDGWRHIAHNRGENDRHQVYNDLGLLLRDAEHVERFHDAAARETKPERDPFQYRYSLGQESVGDGPT